MIVFRDGRRSADASTLARTLAESLPALSTPCPDPGSLLEALLRCGELECGLADIDSAQTTKVAGLTTLLAESCLDAKFAIALRKAARALDGINGGLRLSAPEGFAYYGLHPQQYAQAASVLELRGKQVYVMGVRSIGTTLSAMVTAALRMRGVEVQRTTVRPHGHPFDRVTEFNTQQAADLGKAKTAAADFLIVDEGPGLSGSSLLSVAEALVAAGVASEAITILCAHAPAVEQLRARDAAARWSRFKVIAVAGKAQLPDEAGVDLSYGKWRSHSFADESQWPAAWTSLERLKYRSRDGRRLLKFEGFDPYGAAVRQRAQQLAQAGFSPPAEKAQHGFTAYEWIEGRALSSADLSADLMERMAKYLAWRGENLRTSAEVTCDLAALARFNYSQEFGGELRRDQEKLLGLLAPEQLIIADGRMLPHEWLRARDGRILKTDGGSHGEDHFYPGAVDFSWDLAGTIVEWNLDKYAAEFFLGQFQRHSGLQIGRRLDAMVLAYAMFRIGYCRMAAAALRGSAEAQRLNRAADGYRKLVQDREEQAVAA